MHSHSYLPPTMYRMSVQTYGTGANQPPDTKAQAIVSPSLSHVTGRDLQFAIQAEPVVRLTDQDPSGPMVFSS